MTTQQPATEDVSALDLLVGLIANAQSITNEEKEEMIAKLQADGLPATMQKALISLFEHEADLRDKQAEENKRLVAEQQNVMLDAEREQLELAAGVLKEHDETVSQLVSGCFEACAAEERQCQRDIEGYKRKTDDTQADAIRNFLKN